ncbi:MAG: hypothetical protein AB8H12_17255 [Lewinella sp.]
MKSLLLFPIFLMAVVFLSCEKDEGQTSPLSGEWRLVEVYADPGDGSGSFEPVMSNKTITFGEDGDYTAQGNLCTMEEAADTATSGKFWSDDQNVEPNECISLPAQSGITYAFVGDDLILSYPCIEPCQHKYRKQ